MTDSGTPPSSGNTTPTGANAQTGLQQNLNQQNVNNQVANTQNLNQQNVNNQVVNQQNANAQTGIQVFKPPTPKMGGLAEVGSGVWAAWTGGKPNKDWTGLVDPNPKTISQQQQQ